MAETITLEFLGTQMLRLIEEQARVRDSITVLTGVMIRLEGAVQGLGMALDHDRRLRKLEEGA
jgi:hypothetical protein